MSPLTPSTGNAPIADLNPLIISVGGHSIVEKVSDTVVAKVPVRGWGATVDLLYVEAMIYQRLGPHSCITKFYAFKDGKIYLELLQCSLHQRLSQMYHAEQSPAIVQILRWSLQIAQAFQHIHSRGVLQVDIAPRNMLLDWDDNLKLSDFGGSSIDGSGPTVLPTVSYEHPYYPASTPSIKSELFAIGSAFYELETLQAPYHDLEPDEIGDLFVNNTFPKTNNLILGEVINKCWRIEYANSSQVVDDICKIQERCGFVGGGTEN